MVKTLSFMLVALSCLSPVMAQVMRDPTQPPSAYTVTGSQHENTAVDGEEASRVLQSIVRRHGAKPMAMINGRMLGVGGKIDDWVLVRIDESEVILRGPGGTEKLVMSPDVEKQPVKPAVVRRQR